MNSQEFKFSIATATLDLSSLKENPSLLIHYIPEEILKALKQFIFDQLQNKDGAPNPTDFKITQFEFNESNESGKFRMNFQIDRQFCCADSTACSSDYMDFSFSLSATQLLAKGSFFDWTLTN